MVFAFDSDGTGSQGSGFFINSEGIGITNYHVLEGHSNKTIRLSNGKKYRITKILKQSPADKLDYVIFKVDNNGDTFKSQVISATQTSIGDDVFAIGSPKGLENSLTKGSVSQYRDNDRIQIDATIDHGSSGGPLFNMNGEVIGITSSGVEGSALNFAVDIQAVPYKNYVKKKVETKVVSSPTGTNSTGVNRSFNFYPTSTTNQVVNHKYYSLSYSEKDEQAEWVVYKLTNNSFSNNISRTNDFREDTKVKTGSAELSDYKGSGYDRGHLAPAGSMKVNRTSMSESFYMSNMSPQLPGFNRGIWKRLEEKVRYWADINDSLFVVTGPILDKPLGTIGRNKVTIPRAYYKTLLGYKDGKAKGLAFIMPNKKSKLSLYKYVVSINDIEETTGIDFYHKIDKAVQDEVNADVKLWFLRK